MAGYSKEFLVSAYLSRFMACKNISIETLERLEEAAIKLYDEKGRDKFREYASLDAAAIRTAKASGFTVD